jgi:hypothetical protein
MWCGAVSSAGRPGPAMVGTFVSTSPHPSCSGCSAAGWITRRPGDGGKGRCSVFQRDLSATLQRSGRPGLCHAQGKNAGGDDEIDIDEIVRKLSLEASRMRAEQEEAQAKKPRFEPAASPTDVCSFTPCHGSPCLSKGVL